MELVWFMAGVGAALAAFGAILRLDKDPFEVSYQETQEWLASQRKMAQALERR